MKKRFVLFLCFTILATPSLALAQESAANQQRPRRLQSFMKEGPMASPKEYADRIRACAVQKIWNMNCEETLSSFNKEFKDVPGIGTMESIEELASFFENETVMVKCGTGRVTIAGVAEGKAAYFDRPFADGEDCFRHISTGRLVSSAWCGQWIRQILHPTFKATTEQSTGAAAKQSEGGAGDTESARGKYVDPAASSGGFKSFVKKHWWKAAIVGGIATALALVAGPRAKACGICGNNWQN